MELSNMYESYKSIITAYDARLEEISSQENIEQSPEIFSYFRNTKDKFEQMMDMVSEIEEDENNETDLKDFKYLLTNTYFLSLDVSHFYEYNEMGRLKLRILNYLNNKRRQEMWG